MKASMYVTTEKFLGTVNTCEVPIFARFNNSRTCAKRVSGYPSASLETRG